MESRLNEKIKKRVLISSEQQDALIGYFFKDLGFELISEDDGSKDFSFVTKDLLQKTTLQFIGEIEQFPPIYSAIKKDGVALYELARRGVDVELKARKITISTFEITEINLPVVHFKVICSTGTYIRSLANDFGTAIGCGAYLSSLRRTRIGEFTVADAVEMETFETLFTN